MGSQRQHTFSQVPRAEIPRSSFNRSHGVKTTFNGGGLYPIFVDEILPGDTFNLRTSAFVRMATPIYPIMDNIYMETFYFFVPTRLVWENFQAFMGEQEDPTLPPTDYITPSITSAAGTGFESETLQDYMGLPTLVPGIEVNSLPLRCYNLIWNEWFRDQNLQAPVNVNKGDGPDSNNDYNLLSRGKRHDYFTSALPFTQKGDPVEVPILGTVPVVPTDDQSAPVFREAAGGGPGVNLTSTAAGTNTSWSQSLATTDLMKWQTSGLIADFTDPAGTTAVTINQIRLSFQIQKLLERDARGGTRYTELIRSHFSVTSPDMRLQRPEFLGGGSTRININPIHQTSDLQTVSAEGEVLGRLSAIATGSFNNHGFVKSFTEHGYVIGMVNVRADLTYQKGIERCWLHRDKYDYYWPALAHVGEQEIFNKEIYAQDGSIPANEEIFGYQERYAEYRYKPSMVTGVFRSNHPQSLDSWHLAEDFLDLPTLNAQFIRDTPPLNRVVAVPSEPRFIGDFYHKLICARPMPLFGVPGFVDRF